MILTRGPTSDTTCNRTCLPHKTCSCPCCCHSFLSWFIFVYIQPCPRPFISILHPSPTPPISPPQLLAFTPLLPTLSFLPFVLIRYVEDREKLRITYIIYKINKRKAYKAILRNAAPNSASDTGATVVWRWDRCYGIGIIAIIIDQRFCIRQLRDNI